SGGGAPVTTGTTAPAQGTLAPRVLKFGVKTLKVTRSGKVVVRVSCPKTAVGPCKVVLGGKALAKRTVSVRPGASKTVTLKLKGSQRRLAKRGKAVRVAMSVVGADAQVPAAAQRVHIARRAR
ncbi:MAG: hypothetical protein JHC95_14860, partial [Solirubrobacteraceae bacterium]|nr:hypothetical protein [Solirubrobacteraceae bacterium]